MLRYAILPILLAVAVMAVEAFSVAIQAAPSTKIEAIKDCRAELGERAKYLLFDDEPSDYSLFISKHTRNSRAPGRCCRGR